MSVCPHCGHDATDDPLTVAQVAQRLGVQPAAVRDLIRRRRLPGARKTGKAWRIPPAALAHLERSSTPPHLIR